MLRDAGRAHRMGHVILRYFNVAGADPQGRTGQSSAAATHLIKVAAETALGLRPKLEIFGTDYPTPTVRVSAITSMSAISPMRISWALHYLRSGGTPLTLNCGYGHGFSVREVIETVKRVSAIDFKVENAPRREGDPARIVAASERIRDALGWYPRYDDLPTIVAHALAWERQLMARFPRDTRSRGLVETA